MGYFNTGNLLLTRGSVLFSSLLDLRETWCADPHRRRVVFDSALLVGSAVGEHVRNVLIVVLLTHRRRDLVAAVVFPEIVDDRVGSHVLIWIFDGEPIIERGRTSSRIPHRHLEPL